MSSAVKLTLGPVLFNWKPERLTDFYARIADEAPVDTVCLGEVVCSKRAPFFKDQILDVAERLTKAGKQVVFSTLGLVMDQRDRDLVNDFVAFDEMLIEANDVSAMALMAGKPHAVGPFVNLYNEGALAECERLGAKRICLPVELPLESIKALASVATAEIEVQAFGRMPLALSARCYHARAHNLAKDGCLYICGNHPDGMAVDTIAGQEFLCVNGTQTMSSSYLNLTQDLDDLIAAGVSAFRLWPQDIDMVAVSKIYRELLDHRIDADEADDRLAELAPHVNFANGYVRGFAGHELVD